VQEGPKKQCVGGLTSAKQTTWAFFFPMHGYYYIYMLVFLFSSLV